MVYKRLERHLIQLDKVDSTNDYANDLLKTSQVSNGTIIWAHHQQKGRGQRTNTWTTESGKNLTCSIVLRPEIDARRSFYLNVVVSLAVRKALSDLGLEVKIKWPNDILIGQNKVSGILIENQISGGKIMTAIVGIGLNVNQKDLSNFERATSIVNETGNESEVIDVLDQIYGYLDFYFNLLMESNYNLLLKHYYEHLFRIGIPAKYSDTSGEFEGVILGIDESGRLLIQRDVERRSYEIKEITYLY